MLTWAGVPNSRRSALTTIHYRTTDVDGIKVFYREAIAAGAPKLLLLHGFPTAGHMFRDELVHQAQAAAPS
jgi:pimeloyl-ACP methyl ester carboxylesterase